MARNEFIHFYSAIEVMNEMRLGLSANDTISMPCHFFDTVNAAINYIFKNVAALEKRVAIGKRAGNIANVLITHQAYHQSKGKRKNASLTEAYDVLIGHSIDHKNKTGVNLGFNRRSLNTAWQQYGHVSHLWIGDALIEEAAKRGIITQSRVPEDIARRISWFLGSAKNAYSILKTIVPHSRDDPVFDVNKAHWVSEEVDQDITARSEQSLLDEPTMASISELMKRYKGARNLGKKKMKEKMEPA